MESGQQTRERSSAEVDELRVGLHMMWGAVAPGWEVNADFVDGRTAELTSAMLDAVMLEPGDRVLELACGPGGVGLAAAERVGDEGEVVLSDIAPQMTAVAAGRAKWRGHRNVTTMDLDLERIEQPDGSYDAVLCREGIMLVPDPRAAAAEIRRVLRPGGRAAISTWGRRERNPWLGAMLDAVGAELGVTFPPPGLPGPFSLDGREKLLPVLSRFEDVEITEVETPWRGASFEQWWLTTTALAGPVGKVLEARPPEGVEAIKARARETLSRYETAEGLEIPGVALIGTVTAG